MTEKKISVILTASLRLRSCSLSFCLSRSLSFALSCVGVGVAGVWELGGPAGVANWGWGDVEAVNGVATLGPEGGRSLTVSDSLLITNRK